MCLYTFSSEFHAVLEPGCAFIVATIGYFLCCCGTSHACEVKTKWYPTKDRTNTYCKFAQYHRIHSTMISKVGDWGILVFLLSHSKTDWIQVPSMCIYHGVNSVHSITVRPQISFLYAYERLYETSEIWFGKLQATACESQFIWSVIPFFSPLCFIWTEFLPFFQFPLREHSPPTLSQTHLAANLCTSESLCSDWQENCLS